MKLLPLCMALCLAVVAHANPSAAQEKAPVLSLHEAIAAALKQSPALQGSVERGEAAQAAVSGSSALPNPELAFEAENFGGDGEYAGIDGAELTYGITQLVELPGKRAGRSAIAGQEARRRKLETYRGRLDIIRDVLTAYAAAVAAEDELGVAKEERNLANTVYEGVVAKVDAGKEPPIQKNKAGIELSSAVLALERAERRVAAAKAELANLVVWNDRDFHVSRETLPEMTPPDGLATYAAKLKDAPDALIYDTDISTAQSSLSLEKANATPDPTVSVGIRDLRDEGEQAFVAGVSIPLPVFDLNRARVRQAGHTYNAAVLDKAQANLNINTELARTYENFSNAYREHQVLTGTVLPGAMEAFRAAREGYAAGKFQYLEVLDAQRTLFQARRQSIQTMLDYYREMAVIDRLTGIHAAKETSQ